MDRQTEIEQLKQKIDECYGILKVLQSTPEPKEPETLDELVERMLVNEFQVSANNKGLQKEIADFGKRLVIADYCGRVDREIGQTYTICINDEGKHDIGQFVIDAIGDNHFPTEEAAEKYLRICQKSNLL